MFTGVDVTIFWMGFTAIALVALVFWCWHEINKVDQVNRDPSKDSLK